MRPRCVTQIVRLCSETRGSGWDTSLHTRVRHSSCCGFDTALAVAHDISVGLEAWQGAPLELKQAKTFPYQRKPYVPGC